MIKHFFFIFLYYALSHDHLLKYVIICNKIKIEEKHFAICKLCWDVQTLNHIYSQSVNSCNSRKADSNLLKHHNLSKTYHTWYRLNEPIFPEKHTLLYASWYIHEKIDSQITSTNYVKLFSNSVCSYNEQCANFKAFCQGKDLSIDWWYVYLTISTLGVLISSNKRITSLNVFRLANSLINMNKSAVFCGKLHFECNAGFCVWKFIIKRHK